MDNRKNNRGGARKGAGRKKGIGLTYEIQKHCQKFVEELLNEDAIRLKLTQQLAENKNEISLEYLYIIENNKKYKIGYSSNFKKRLKNYKTHLGEVNLIYLTKQKNCFNLESDIHEMFESKNISGEWFNLDNDDIFKIIAHCSNKIE
tara:strand:+ start:287 stop:727 length:441 start_codon:yes stop_codon:yes gene_type:complete